LRSNEPRELQNSFALPVTAFRGSLALSFTHFPTRNPQSRRCAGSRVRPLTSPSFVLPRILWEAPACGPGSRGSCLFGHNDKDRSRTRRVSFLALSNRNLSLVRCFHHLLRTRILLHYRLSTRNRPLSFAVFVSQYRRQFERCQQQQDGANHE
jgi:hypothetical protein